MFLKLHAIYIVDIVLAFSVLNINVVCCKRSHSSMSGGIQAHTLHDVGKGVVIGPYGELPTP